VENRSFQKALGKGVWDPAVHVSPLLTIRRLQPEDTLGEDGYKT
jgi:hypothetical protein